MFLSNSVIIIILFPFFDTIVLETPSVQCLRNQSRFSHIPDYMEDLWIHVFNRTYQNDLDFSRVECKHFDYIALILIEDQRLVELWAEY